MSLLRGFSLVLVAAVVVATQVVADPPAKAKTAEPLGVYFYKTKAGVWLVTYERGGMGRCEARLIRDGKVHEERYEFRWSMNGNEIVKERITDDPDLWIDERFLFLPDGAIRPLKAYRDGKLLWEAPKDAPAMEFLGLEAEPRRVVKADSTKPADQAKAVVLEYIKAMRAKDLERLEKVVDVAWLDYGNQIIKDRGELTKWLKRKLDAVGDPAQFPSQVLQIRKYSEISDKITDEKVRKLADQVLAKDDLVVHVGRQGVIWNSHFIKISDGKAKVVGFEK